MPSPAARCPARPDVLRRNLHAVDDGLQLRQPLKLHIEIATILGDATFELLDYPLELLELTTRGWPVRVAVSNSYSAVYFRPRRTTTQRLRCHTCGPVLAKRTPELPGRLGPRLDWQLDRQMAACFCLQLNDLGASPLQRPFLD